LEIADLVAELIAIDRIDDGPQFQVRPLGDLSALATDLARLGQLFPVDVRPRGERYQLICGYRRLAALKFLRRDQVLARVHPGLSDQDALLMAVASAVHGAAASRDDLAGFKGTLEREGRLSPAVRLLLDNALAADSSLASASADAEEGGEEEVEADELAEEVAARLGELNHDLALLADVFPSLEGRHREELLRQLRYPAELMAYLEGL
jgi:ParB-like chromosome segregation protein Spo0J